MSSKAIRRLPHFYKDVPPATNVKHSDVPTTSVTSLIRNDFNKKCTEGENKWLEHVRNVLENPEKSSDKLIKFVLG